MEMRRIGKSGLEVSRLGLGTMTWGRDTDEHEAADQLRTYREAGGNFIDTAASYGDGDSERVIAGFIGTLLKREEIIISTKAGLSFKDPHRRYNNSRANLLSELDGSLNRLNVEYVDLWLVQGRDGQTPIEETLSAMDQAVISGKARYVGFSNINGWQLAQAATLQNPIFGKSAISALQSEYSLLNRSIEDEIIPASTELGIGLLAWSPLGRGVLTGKYRNGTPSDSRGASPHFAEFIAPYLDDRSRSIVEAVCVAAEGLGYSPLEVALAWVRDSGYIASSIVGARTGAQLRGVLTSEEISLPEPVRQALNDISM